MQTDLAINRNVAPARQNQAMNALVFQYKKIVEPGEFAEETGYALQM